MSSMFMPIEEILSLYRLNPKGMAWQVKDKKFWFDFGKKFKVFAKSNFACADCAEPASHAYLNFNKTRIVPKIICKNKILTIDHILAKKFGGHRTDITNQQALCYLCHKKKNKWENNFAPNHKRPSFKTLEKGMVFKKQFSKGRQRVFTIGTAGFDHMLVYRSDAPFHIFIMKKKTLYHRYVFTKKVSFDELLMLR